MRTLLVIILMLGLQAMAHCQVQANPTYMKTVYVTSDILINGVPDKYNPNRTIYTIPVIEDRKEIGKMYVSLSNNMDWGAWKRNAHSYVQVTAIMQRIPKVETVMVDGKPFNRSTVNLTDPLVSYEYASWQIINKDEWLTMVNAQGEILDASLQKERVGYYRLVQ